MFDIFGAGRKHQRHSGEWFEVVVKRGIRMAGAINERQLESGDISHAVQSAALRIDPDDFVNGVLLE